MEATQPRQYQALFRSCIKEAAAQGRGLMQRTLTRALAAMPQKAALINDVVERNLLAEAARVLGQHEVALSEAYPQALLAEFAQALAGDARKGDGVSFEALELMADDQVQESVEVMRTQQAVLAAVETELAELNALICAVQGLRTVQPQRNPLRPEVYVRALRTVTQESPVPASARRRWLLHLGEAMGPELARSYAGLSAQLRIEGVTAAGFNRITRDGPPLPAGTTLPSAYLAQGTHAAHGGAAADAAHAAPGAGAAGMHAVASAPWTGSAAAAQGSGSAGAGSLPVASGTGSVDPRTLLNVRELRRLLAGEFEEAPPPPGESASAGPPPEFSATMPAAFEALQEMHQVDEVMRRLRAQRSVTTAETGPAASPREVLRRQARGPAQRLAMEVVSVMIDNIAADARLLPSVQRAVRELEPALLRLALADPRFFSERRHPARQLLDELTQRSLAWTAEHEAGFAAFMDPLQQAVEALVDTQVSGAEPFAFALQTLRDAWGDAQRRDRRQREKAVKALLHAEQRNLLADTLGRQLRERGDFVRAPRFVQQFLAGPWVQVMAQARLADSSGALDPQGFNSLVPDLLWSSQLELARANLTRLARLVPPLVQGLRRGLAGIDYPAAQAALFFDQLAAVHAQALRGDAATPAATAEPAPERMTRAQLEASFAANDAAQDAWLAPAEARESGFMPTDLGAAPAPLFQATQPAAGAAEEGAPSELALPELGLSAGAWVELLEGEGWARWQLSWASPHGTLFMFTHASGRTQSMTRRLVQKMASHGSLRLVSGQALVDGALDAVAEEALRNSVDLKL